MEGLQIIKPRSPHSIRRDSPEGPLKETAERFGGMNVEVDIVNCEDDVDDGMGKWIVENLKFSVKQPVRGFSSLSFNFCLPALCNKEVCCIWQIEAAVTKTELQYLAFLCKSEVDSMGRISAGILRVLKLESKIGAGAISQLSNLGNLCILFGTSFSHYISSFCSLEILYLNKLSESVALLITKIEVSALR